MELVFSTVPSWLCVVYLERCWWHTSVLGTAEQCSHSISVVSPAFHLPPVDFGVTSLTQTDKKGYSILSNICSDIKVKKKKRKQTINYYDICFLEKLLSMLSPAFLEGLDIVWWWEVENKIFWLFSLLCGFNLAFALWNCLYLDPQVFIVVLFSSSLSCWGSEC